MSELKERNSNIERKMHTQVKEHAMTGRSLRSLDPQSYRNVTISPWAGEEYYTKVKREIQEQRHKKRSSTAKSIRHKPNDKLVVPKLNTVQLEMTPLPQQALKTQWGKYFQSKMSSQFTTKDITSPQSFPQKEKEQRTTTVSFKEAEPIHQRKSSSKQMQRKADRLHTEISRQSLAAPPAALAAKNDRRSLLFFFQARQGSNVVNRERMIMKIRNIEKGRAQRVYTLGG